MPKIIKSNLSIGERAKIDNANANSSLNVDVNAKNQEIVSKIRERYSLSDEIAIIRKALMKAGIEDEQLSTYCDFVEGVKQSISEREEVKGGTEL